MNVMQAILDLCERGKQMVSPFFKGALNTMTGVSESGSKASTEVVKKAQEISVVKGSIFKNLFCFDRQLIRLAGLSGAIAFGLGTYGTQVVLLNNDVSEEQKTSFKITSIYHYFGTFGLVTASMTRYPAVSGALMAIGTTIFCGAGYYFSLTGDTSSRKVAHLGGTTLVAAWLSFIL